MKKNQMFLFGGLIAIVLVIGFIFLLGNNTAEDNSKVNESLTTSKESAETKEEINNKSNVKENITNEEETNITNQNEEKGSNISNNETYTEIEKYINVTDLNLPDLPDEI